MKRKNQTQMLKLESGDENTTENILKMKVTKTISINPPGRI